MYDICEIYSGRIQNSNNRLKVFDELQENTANYRKITRKYLKVIGIMQQIVVDKTP